jgi:hypothetical protein
VKGRQRRRDSKTQLKSGRNVQNNAHKRNDDGHERIFLKFFADGRTDLGGGVDHELIIGELLGEDGHHTFRHFFLNRRGRLDSDKQLIVLPEFL